MAQKNLSAFLPSDFPQSTLGAIETTIGRKLIEADVVRMQIEALQYSATSDRFGQFIAMVMTGLLIGACIGCAIVSRM